MQDIPPEKSLIEYPSRFPIKVMGDNVDGFVHAVTQVARQFDPNFNAADIARMLIDAGAALQVDSAGALAAALAALATDVDKRTDMGRAGQQVLQANRGALDRLLRLIEDPGATPDQWLVGTKKSGSASATGSKKAAHEPAPKAKLPPKAALPESFSPQLATLVNAPPQPAGDWLYELKYDGYRIGCHIRDSRVTLISRNGRDWMRRDFGWDRVASEMAAVYRWAAHGGAPPGCVRFD